MVTQRSYEVVSGYFLQDTQDPRALPAIPPRFGLVDESPDRWRKLKADLQKLNASTEPGTAYKLFFLGRHGEGHHNVALEKYSATWKEHWSKQITDGELVWGPDAELTQLGLGQAAQARDMWKEELKFDIPLPQKMYCSPLTRALKTQEITFQGIEGAGKTVVVEFCREQTGVSVCDKRRSRTYIQNTFPMFEIEDGFTEEDQLWLPDVRESPDQVLSRARKVVDTIFETDKVQSVVAITAHGGIVASICMVFNAKFPVSIPTGGVLPVLVKSTVRELVN